MFVGDGALDRIKTFGISTHGRGTRAGAYVQMSEPTRITNRSRSSSDVTSSNINNLVHLHSDIVCRKPTIVSTHDVTPSITQTGSNAEYLCRIAFSNQPLIRFAKLNACSVCTKGAALCEYIKNNNLDVFDVTETWLNVGSEIVIAEITPPELSMQHEPRPSGHGGGVAMVYKDLKTACMRILLNIKVS